MPTGHSDIPRCDRPMRGGGVELGWIGQLRGDSVSWLLEADTPAVRCVALRELLDRLEGDPEVVRTRAAPEKS
jgi:hypothetical protein